MLDSFRLNCLIEGESLSRVFTVTVGRDRYVSELKKLVKGEIDASNSVLAKDLELWKVEVNFDDYVDQNAVIQLKENDAGSQQLTPWKSIADYWPSQLDPADGHLRVFVKLPSTDGYSKRLQTVTSIYEKLCKYKYIQVRGTPASGKSVLAMLLHEFILNREPGTKVARIPQWKEESEMDMKGGWRNWLWLRAQWTSKNNSVLIVDEAQGSYWDRNFWVDTIKQMKSTTPYRIITFASYGSTGSDPACATPFYPQLSQIIGLRSINNAGGKTQLCLSIEEYNDFVKIAFPNDGRFDSALLDIVYDLTDGHVGACYDCLEVIHEHESYRKCSGQYTIERFDTHFDMKTLLSGLVGKTIFSRGLPKPYTLQSPDVNRVFKTLLETENPKELKSVTEIPGLAYCIKQGWIYETASDDANKPSQCYMFASPLHRHYLNYFLYPSTIELEEDNIFEFIRKVIRLMSPASFTEARQLGTFVQSIPEAQFQKDFYAACCEYGDRGLVSFPELGTKDGRIDFFIHCKKWGIELLRNGVRLASHVSRFTQGEYEVWLKEGYMKDYIILDFRSPKLPNADHSEHENFYYVVYAENWTDVKIYDNKRDLRDHFNPTRIR